MPGPADLMALLQQGGGGGGGGGMPPGGGGGMPPGAPPGGGMGAMLQQVLGQLMQDPGAMKAMQQYMMQMGQGGTPGAPGDPQAPPPNMPQQDGPPGMQPGGEQDMVNDEIDRKGATFDGDSAPTANDIERLQADPSDANVKAFDAQFGDGMAEKYLEEDKGEGPEGNSPPDKEDASES